MGVVTMILMNHNQLKEIAYLLKQGPFGRRVVMVKVQQPFMINVYNIKNSYNNNTYHGNVKHNHTFQEYLKKKEKLMEQNRKTIAELLQEREANSWQD